MASPQGIIPDDWFTPRRLGDVMEYLKKLHMPGDDKEKLLVGWARWVGMRINASQRAAVRNSGFDR